jgi:hypothetical protein
MRTSDRLTMAKPRFTLRRGLASVKVLTNLLVYKLILEVAKLNVSVVAFRYFRRG